MAQKVQTGPMQIGHGHTDTHVVVQLPRQVDHINLTPAQAEDFIAAMRVSIDKLKEHQEKLAAAAGGPKN